MKGLIQEGIILESVEVGAPVGIIGCNYRGGGGVQSTAVLLI